MTDAAARVWVFDDFRPGEPLGRHAIALDEARLATWRAIYGASAEEGHVPSGMLVAAMMEAYLMAIRPRPPGNVHAAQTLAFGAPAKAGDRLDAEVSCLWKEMRRTRCWVGFGVVLRDGGRCVLTGEISAIWSR
ncbi:hypothetical protein EZH22_12845 [Xanthobacter dioxanivorans]|uniref:Uncharacterized protein n=1 Tax=Xanthobacter dioxanivorans TaxID=2528964 RepID=A0A974PSU9_9HYPH|nr:hypothetical protein [Xanthobacter dioxanivorans]QRG09075.1 hypothetical protein EZH22_12845 [Xanthobacter dioxanivorans]